MVWRSDLNWKRTVWVTLIMSRLVAWDEVEEFKPLNIVYRRKTNTVRMPAGARCFSSIALIWPMMEEANRVDSSAAGDKRAFC